MPELYQLEWGKQGQRWVLEVMIDKKDGPVTTGDCATVSNKLSDELDKSGLITKSYELQVSSPGVERPLNEPRHYRLAVGRQITAKTFAKVDGRKQFEGELVDYDEEKQKIQVETQDGTVDLVLSNIAKSTTKDDN